MAIQGRAAVDSISRQLLASYPDAKYELDWSTPLELLVATILAAQCTDERVNRVTKDLFPRYADARAYADAEIEELEEVIRPTGYYRNKAKAIMGACRGLVDRFRGQVPRTVEELITLPGVARKTANVVLNTAFDIPSGIIVDTHVARVSRRLGLTREDKPDRIETDLMKLVPQDQWTKWAPAMVLHGRYVCTANSPHCPDCELAPWCERDGVTTVASAPAPARRSALSASPPSSTSRTQPHALATSAAPPASPRSAPTKDQLSLFADAEDADADADWNADDESDSNLETPAVSSLASLPSSWAPILAEEAEKPYFQDLMAFVAQERAQNQVFPPEDEVYSALDLTPYEKVNVLLLGQDPYHDDGQAHGLCFSVKPGIKPPPSLVNMFKELHSDLGVPVPKTGYLVPWAQQGMLMLNAVLTVQAHKPNSHKDRGWEQFTDAVIRKVNEKTDPVVFVLWGAYAKKKAKLINAKKHVIIQGAHPSPLSAHMGFFGSKPFSTINQALRDLGKTEIDWRL